MAHAWRPEGLEKTAPRGGRRRRVVIMGAAGRDFHNFNVVFREDRASEVVAFTAAQIPNIASRIYPAALAGALYPDGIPIVPEDQLAGLIVRERVEDVWFSYSDVPHLQVMHKASITLAAGANFGLLGPRATMLESGVPVVSVCAVRTGAGKSPLSRHIVRWLRSRGNQVVAIRHPMPYGNLARQVVQRFAAMSDLDESEVTIEEREEYEPYIEIGAVVFAGVDYRLIVERAQREADVILWDGGNNDFPFIRPDLHIVLLDAHRPGHEVLYHPGETNFRMADVLVVSKVDSAPPHHVETMVANATAARPGVPLLLAELTVAADRSELITGRTVVVVEDGPTLTHGGMRTGAGTIAARRYGAAMVIDARPFAVGSIAETFREFAHLQGEVPAMGYTPEQIRDLEATLRRAPADVVIDATPVDLSRLIDPGKPIVNVTYEFKERGDRLPAILEEFERKFLHRGEATHHDQGMRRTT